MTSYAVRADVDEPRCEENGGHPRQTDCRSEGDDKHRLKDPNNPLGHDAIIAPPGLSVTPECRATTRYVRRYRLAGPLVRRRS